MVTLKPIKLLPARERVASALRKAIISKQINEGEVITLESTAQQLGELHQCGRHFKSWQEMASLT